VLALKDQGPALARLLGDPDAEVRALTRQVLVEMANLRSRWPRPAASAENETPDPLLQGIAAALAPLGRSLADPDVGARRAALDILESLGPASSPAAPILVKALEDPDRFVRWAATRTLGKIAPQMAETAVPGLVRLLSDADLDLRLAATTTLERYGPAAREAVPALVRLVYAQEAAEVRVAAIRVLIRIGQPSGQEPIVALRTVLADPDERVRRMAAQGLGSYGPAARMAVEALRQARSDSSPAVQKAAGDALLLILQPGDGSANQ